MADNRMQQATVSDFIVILFVVFAAFLSPRQSRPTESCHGYKFIMDDVINDFVDPAILKVARDDYRSTPNDTTKTKYGICMARCESEENVKVGIGLLNSVFVSTSDSQTKRDCLYYLAVGNAKLKNYSKALEYTEQLIQREPYNRQFQEWKSYLNEKLALAGVAVVGGLGLLGLVGFGAYKLGKYLLSDKDDIEEDVPSANGGRGRSLMDSLSGELQACHVGSEFNQWKRSIANYGTCDRGWVEQLKASPFVGEVDFGRRQWDRACRAVDEVRRCLLQKMKSQSSYTGLKIDSFILQGSSRDGLKVIAPDEFDVGFEFHIDGIHLRDVSITKQGEPIPGFCYLEVTTSASRVERNCPELWRKGVFIQKDGCLYLSSKLLHRSVFTSLMDKSIIDVAREFKEKGGEGFQIKRKYNPPAVNITIILDEETNAFLSPSGARRGPATYTNEIDVDIIPALRLRTDSDSTCDGIRVNAPIHAICKWKEEESAKALEFADQNRVWLLNSVAYERFVFDLAQNDEKRQYILTALRILKTYMTKVKIGKCPPPQIGTILQSYHLKQLTCYLILYTCYMFPGIRIDGAQRALLYLLGLLEVCLEKGVLPHFFYSNSQISQMFQNYPAAYRNTPLRFNMLRKVSSESLCQALLSLRRKLKPDLGLTSTSVNGRSSDNDLSRLKSEFISEISCGKYF